MTLTGPAPEIERDRWGRPLLAPRPGAKPEPYTRATTVAKTLEDQSALMAWKARMTMLGLVARRDLLVAAAATDVENKKELNRIAEAAADAGGATAAATTGTALHAFTERLDRGLDVGFVPEEHRADLDAYQALGDTIGWKVHEVELFTVDHSNRVAGTADRLLEIDGRRYIADLKTGTSVAYHHAWSVQFAIYAHALPWDVEAGCTRPWDVVPDQERALVIHLPAGKGEAYAHWIDIAAGWRAYQQSMWVRAWRKRRDLLTPWEPGTRAATLDERIAEAPSVNALTTLWAENQDRWTDAHTRLATARKIELRARS